MDLLTVREAAEWLHADRNYVYIPYIVFGVSAAWLLMFAYANDLIDI